MKPKRKHRLFVDVTFNAPLTEREAAKVLQAQLDDVDRERRPIRCLRSREIYVDKWRTKTRSGVEAADAGLLSRILKMTE